jgi:hypothetical protein
MQATEERETRVRWRKNERMVFVHQFENLRRQRPDLPMCQLAMEAQLVFTDERQRPFISPSNIRWFDQVKTELDLKGLISKPMPELLQHIGPVESVKISKIITESANAVDGITTALNDIQQNVSKDEQHQQQTEPTVETQPEAKIEVKAAEEPKKLSVAESLAQINVNLTKLVETNTALSDLILEMMAGGVRTVPAPKAQVQPEPVAVAKTGPVRPPEDDDEDDDPADAIGNRKEANVDNRPKIVIICTRKYRDEFEEKYGCDSDKVKLVYPHPDNAKEIYDATKHAVKVYNFTNVPYAVHEQLKAQFGPKRYRHLKAFDIFRAYGELDKFILDEKAKWNKHQPLSADGQFHKVKVDPREQVLRQIPEDDADDHGQPISHESALHLT